MCFAVSADGRVVGGVGATSFNNAGDRAFLWIEDVGFFDAKFLLEPYYGLDLGSWRLVATRGISDDGLVWAGVGINPSGDTEGWMVSVTELPTSLPEPTTLTLLSLGLLLSFAREGARLGTRRRSRLA